MKRAWLLPSICLLALPLLVMARSSGRHETRARKSDASSDASLRTRIQAFLERTLGWQQLDEIKIAILSEPDSSGMRAVKVDLTKGTQHGEQTYYISPDGREIVLGQGMAALSGDPWRKTREKLTEDGSPAEGPANAPVTIYEFSDLECPFCREENQAIQQMMQEIPNQARVIFKYYPLVKIHPWSMQAAEVAACVVHENPQHFWPFEQAVFDHQKELTPANAPSRLRDFALESGTGAAAFDACMQSARPHRTVAATIAQGDAVGVVSTPTLFVDGRPIDGAIPEATLKSLVEHEAKMAPLYDGDSGKLAVGALKGTQCGQCKPLPPIPHSH